MVRVGDKPKPSSGTVRIGISPAIANVFKQLFAIRQAIDNTVKFKTPQALENKRNFLRDINDSIEELVYLLSKDLEVEMSVIWGQLEDFAPGIQLPDPVEVKETKNPLEEKKVEYFLEPKRKGYL